LLFGPKYFIERLLFRLTLEAKAPQQRQVELSRRDFPLQRVGDNDLFWLGDAFHPRGYIHHVSKDVVRLHDPYSMV
jgi:hypothetical protein